MQNVFKDGIGTEECWDVIAQRWKKCLNAKYPLLVILRISIVMADKPVSSKAYILQISIGACFLSIVSESLCRISETNN